MLRDRLIIAATAVVVQTLQLFGWGDTTGAGQVGNDEDGTRASPVQVGTLTSWSSIFAGPGHSVARKTDSTIWAWGNANVGQLGQTTDIANRSSPVQIGTLTDWAVAVASAGANSFAIKNESTLWGWGIGTSGQLAQVTVSVSRSSPVQIGTLTDWATVDAGTTYTISRKTDSTIWAWGSDSSGQLAQVATTANRSSPVQIGTLTDWASIGSGSSHAVARKTDSTIWAWGADSTGQLAQVTATANRSSPVQIGTLTDWATISSGIAHVLARKTDGTIWAWGSGNNGQLAQVTVAAVRSSPVQIGTLTDWATVDAGDGHSFAMKNDGTLWAWGEATQGKIGDGLKVNRSSPVQIGTLTDWATVSGGGTHTLARKTDGTIWAWGVGTSGQLDNNEDGTRFSPTAIGAAHKWTTVSASTSHTVAYKTDGTIWAWGLGNFGQLGQVTVTTTRSSPVQIGTLTDWALAVAAGESHSLATKTNGTIWAWGLGTSGQLGQAPSAVSRSSPVQIGTLTDWLSLGRGLGLHTSSVKSDGTLWAWGAGTSGQVGDLTKVARSSPVQIGTLTSWSSVTLGGSHSLARKTDGTIWAWGITTFGQLGNNEEVIRFSPVQVGALVDWASVAGGFSHSLARKTDGTIWAWGLGSNGLLGEITAAVSRSSPVQIGTLTSWSSVAASRTHSLARKTDGTIWAWGAGNTGALGEATTIANRSSPVQIGTLTDWATISQHGSSSHSLATKTDGTIWAWGTGTSGQLAETTVAATRSSPVQIGTLTDWAAVAAGGVHSLAKKTDGTIWAWGQGNTGPLGEITTTASRSSPIQIGTLTSWASVAGGFSHSLATKTDGTIWAWGDGASGTLGQVSTIASRSSPVQIGTLTDWAAATGSVSHSLATKTDGTLWAWGLGTTAGQLGDSAKINRSSPVQIGTLTSWSLVSAGESHSLATKTDSTLFSWGLATSGQLGNNEDGTRFSPVQIGTLTAWASIGIGHSHSLAVKTEGTLWVWGIGSNGQLGETATTANRSSPVQIGTLTDWAAAVGGISHSLARKTDNTVWAWGVGTDSQLGDSAKVSRSSPVQIGTLTGWTDITGGDSHSIAIRNTA